MDIRQDLLVEGNDDLHVVYALCKHFNLEKTFDVTDCKGIDNIFNSLPVRLKGSSATKTVGVIIDADADLRTRWEAIRNILAASGLYGKIPPTCPDKGLILNPTIPEDVRFGLWIMPDNRTDGMLEHFTTMLVPAGDSLMPFIDETLTEP